MPVDAFKFSLAESWKNWSDAGEGMSMGYVHNSLARDDHTLEAVLGVLPRHASVLDYGCFGWSVHRLAATLGRTDIEIDGADVSEPPGKPTGAGFRKVSPGETDGLESDRYDLVIISHVLEHVDDPIRLFGGLTRVCAPGGRIFVEAPSERAAMMRSDPLPEKHGFSSHWDDPTHRRCWPPAALYRLGICHGMRPIVTRHVSSRLVALLLPLIRLQCWITGADPTPAAWLACGFVARGIFQKPADASGAMPFRYLSLRGVPSGVDAALALYRQCLAVDNGATGDPSREGDALVDP
jgi:SAM-dependent methyltransferase